ncbi:MAG: hypothetical protein KDA65_10015 [Planctomycetaceae bacterium]|nr:hypothetical protein [Planctomycetaceae bacterium]
MSHSSRFIFVRRCCLAFAVFMIGVGILTNVVLWQVQRQRDQIVEFVRTTNIEQNPWGIERGMRLEEVKTLLPEQTEKIERTRFIAPTGHDFEYAFKSSTGFYILHLVYAPNTLGENPEIVQLYLGHEEQESHPILQWLESHFKY